MIYQDIEMLFLEKWKRNGKKQGETFLFQRQIIRSVVWNIRDGANLSQRFTRSVFLRNSRRLLLFSRDEWEWC